MSLYPRIGKYEIIERLGVGGLGEVFRARPIDDRPAPVVALKMLREKWHRRSDLAQLFASEADIGLHLQHPNIVRTYEIGFDERERLFLVMEYIAGRNLGEVIDKIGPHQLIAYEVSLHLVRCLLSGLHSAHELTAADGSPLELVHRDIAPDNVFVSYDGDVKLSDFGLAHLEALDGSAANRGTFGKLPYMPPEQVRQQHIDRRADVYGCGVILYELLTGIHPFVAGEQIDDATLTDRIVRGKYRRPRELLPVIPVELEAVVVKAMETDPNRRYATAQEMELALVPFYRSRAFWAPIVAGMMRHIFAQEYAQLLRAMQQHQPTT